MNSNLREKAMDRKNHRPMRRKAGNPSFITKDLNLSEFQQKEFDSIWQHYNGKRQAIEEEMEENRLEMGSIMSRSELDTSSFYEISSLQTELMLALDHSMINMNLALRSTLNTEQMGSFLKRIEMLNKRRSMARQGDPQMKKRVK